MAREGEIADALLAMAEAEDLLYEAANTFERFKMPWVAKNCAERAADIRKTIDELEKSVERIEKGRKKQ